MQGDAAVDKRSVCVGMGRLTGSRELDVLLIAPSAALARLLLQHLHACGLTCERAASAADLVPVLSDLPTPRLVLIVSDNQLERARARSALAGAVSWAEVPVLEVGRGALAVADLSLLLAGHVHDPLRTP
jgi:hypothetical protein